MWSLFYEPIDPIQKIRSSELVAPDDPGYLRFVSQMSGVEGPEAGGRSRMTAGQVVEEAFRRALRVRNEVVETRIIHSEVLWTGRRDYADHYVEVDAIVREPHPSHPDATLLTLYEVKLGALPDDLEKGRHQLMSAAVLLDNALDVALSLVLVSVRPPASVPVTEPAPWRDADRVRQPHAQVVEESVAVDELLPYISERERQLVIAALARHGQDSL